MEYLSVQDLTDRADMLSAQRLVMESAWNDVAMVAYPTLEDTNRFGGRNGTIQTRQGQVNPRGAQRSRNIYDSVGVVASERLTAGLESLITPQAAFWHGFASSGEFEDEPEPDEGLWYETLRNYLFAARYDPRCGFPLANQRSIRSMVGLGHGIIFVEEAFAVGNMPTFAHYKFIPIGECYMDVDPNGIHDTMFRSFARTAKQIVQQFGEPNCSAGVMRQYTRASTMDQKFEILHAVYPCSKTGKWCSQYVDVENRHEMARGYFNEFPYIIYPWLPIDGSAYAESPAMLALAELKSLQAMGRDALIASQQSIRPALASAYAPDVAINMNPGAVNPKMIDPSTGRMLVQPILNQSNPNLFEAVMTLRRVQVKDALYLNLWMSLSQNGQMSATEASIRAAEKGELLGPAASRVQQGLAMLVEREVAILERKGAFRQGSALAPPPSMAGKPIKIRFTAPIDRMRKAGDATGIQRTLETMMQMAQAGRPDVMDNLDVDTTIDIVRDRLGAPRKMFKLPNVVAQERAAKQQQQSMQQAAAAAQPVAAAAKDGASALQTLQQIQGASGQATLPGAQ